MAHIEFDDPGGWGVSQERRLIFVKNRFLLVRDRFTFPTSMAVSAGPAWHAGNLAPEHGDNWWDISYREPLSNVWKLRNPERYALLWLATSVAGLVVGIFPGLIVKFALLVQFQMLTALFVVGFIFTLAIVLGFSVVISRLTERNRILAQELALLSTRMSENDQGRASG